MSSLKSQVNTRSPEFSTNVAAMQELVGNLRELLGKVAEGGGPAARGRGGGPDAAQPRRIDSGGDR